MGSVVPGAGVNPADQRWHWWPLAALEQVIFRELRRLSLIGLQIFVQLGWSVCNTKNGCSIWRRMFGFYAYSKDYEEIELLMPQRKVFRCQSVGIFRD